MGVQSHGMDRKNDHLPHRSGIGLPRGPYPWLMVRVDQQYARTANDVSGIQDLTAASVTIHIAAYAVTASTVMQNTPSRRNALTNNQGQRPLVPQTIMHDRQCQYSTSALEIFLAKQIHQETCRQCRSDANWCNTAKEYDQNFTRQYNLWLRHRSEGGVVTTRPVPSNNAHN